jgi:hypothetical protein
MVVSKARLSLAYLLHQVLILGKALYQLAQQPEVVATAWTKQLLAVLL